VVIKALWNSRLFRTERILIFASLLASLTLFLGITYEFSCQLSFLQNVLVPFIVAYLVLRKVYTASLGRRLLIGISISSLAGAIPALFLIVISNLKYYFLGGIDEAASILGVPPPQLTATTLYVGIGSTIVIWILLVIASALTGLGAGIMSGFKRLR
jgi:hypothetical protein